MGILNKKPTPLENAAGCPNSLTEWTTIDSQPGGGNGKVHKNAGVRVYFSCPKLPDVAVVADQREWGNADVSISKEVNRKEASADLSAAIGSSCVNCVFRDQRMDRIVEHAPLPDGRLSIDTTWSDPSGTLPTVTKVVLQ